MNLAKISGAGLLAASKLTNQDWIAILGILIMILGMVQDYLKNKKDGPS